jgi:hypothetical protein
MTGTILTKRFWPLLIVAIVLGFMAAMAVTFRLAGRAGAVVDHDYYEHGRQYEGQAARERNAERAGWRLSFIRQGGNLLVTVTDGEGRGVVGAEVRYLPAATDADSGQRLPEKGAGAYLLSAAALTATQGRLTVSRGDCYLQSRLAVVGP